MNSKKKRKLIAGALVAASATLCITGSLAFFTDRADGTVFAKAGTMDMVFTDTSSSKTGDNGILSNNEFAIDKTWDNESLVSDGMIINPGDFFDVSYNLSNAGNKSMDIRQKITITSEEPMFQMLSTYVAGAVPPEVGALFTGGYYLTDAAGNFVTTRGESTENYIYDPTVYDYIAFSGVVSEDGKSITYELPDTTLSGVGTAAEDAGTGDLSWDLQTVSENNYKPHENLVQVSDMTPAKEELVGKTINLNVDGNEISAVLNLSTEEKDYSIFNNGGLIVVYKANTTWNGVTFEKPGVYSDDYAIFGATGTGSIEGLGEGGFDSELDNNYILHFAGMSGNEFQGKGVTVKLDIQAKQHHNTGEDTWVDWASYETTVEQVN